MAGTPGHIHLDQQCFLRALKEMWTRIKIIQHIIPYMLKTCYLGTLSMSKQNHSKWWYQFIPHFKNNCGIDLEL